MADEQSLRKYKKFYSFLLAFHSRQHRERFSEAMQQTFTDHLRENAEKNNLLFNCALKMYADTITEIIKEKFHMIKSNFIYRIAVITLLILMLPLLATLFTSEANWTIFDFVFMSILLFSAGLTFELISRNVKNLSYKVAVGLAVLVCLLLVWINGAVGIIGNEGNPANLMYLSVILTGIFGAIISMTPRGLSITAFTMAFVQFMVPVIALVSGNPQITEAPPGLMDVMILSNFFTVLLIVSGLLFRRAAKLQQI